MKTKEEVINSIHDLYNEIDDTIGDLIRARLSKDTELEGKCLFKMESLMVATQQELSFINDYLESN